MSNLRLTNLSIKVDGKQVVNKLNLTLNGGQIIALMGPNGSGKSSLANALMGHPSYQVTAGKALLGQKDLLKLSPDQRAQAGVFLAFQYPVGITGVSVRQMLLASLRARGQKITALELKKKIEVLAKELGLKEELINRDLNDGFSGGEKKKMEILQLKLLAPKVAILDETDSGLDIDALKIVAKHARQAARKNNTAVLVITHYQRLLNYLKPEKVVVLKNGKIVDSGGQALVAKLEKSGYKMYD